MNKSLALILLLSPLCTSLIAMEVPGAAAKKQRTAADEREAVEREVSMLLSTNLAKPINEAAPVQPQPSTESAKIANLYSIIESLVTLMGHTHNGKNILSAASIIPHLHFLHEIDVMDAMGISRESYANYLVNAFKKQNCFILQSVRKKLWNKYWNKSPGIIDFLKKVPAINDEDIPQANVNSLVAEGMHLHPKFKSFAEESLGCTLFDVIPQALQATAPAKMALSTPPTSLSAKSAMPTASIFAQQAPSVPMKQASMPAAKQALDPAAVVLATKKTQEELFEDLRRQLEGEQAARRAAVQKIEQTHKDAIKALLKRIEDLESKIK